MRRKTTGQEDTHPLSFPFCNIMMYGQNENSEVAGQRDTK